MTMGLNHNIILKISTYIPYTLSILNTSNKIFFSNSFQNITMRLKLSLYTYILKVEMFCSYDILYLNEIILGDRLDLHSTINFIFFVTIYFTF